jgi:galactonate dehydratase
VKITGVDTFVVDAGWRPWQFVAVRTDAGITGYGECSDGRNPYGVVATVSDFSAILVGKDPRPVEMRYQDMYRMARQSAGGIAAKAIAGIELALWDIKAKALGVPVYELFGGPTRDDVDVYWSHCGTTRARAWQVTNTPKLASYDDVTALGREVVERGFRAFKTNIVIPGDEPQVLMPGFQGDGLDRNPSSEMEDALVRLLDAFRAGTDGKAQPVVDLNFNLTAEGVLRVARTLEGHDLLWLEVDAFDPVSLGALRSSSAIPICSGENLYTNRGFRPFFEAAAMDVASVDVIWNGFHQAKKIADLAETFEVNCAPHNYYSHLATFISAQWCAAIPNVRILEVDVDDVPWREQLTTAVPEITDGKLAIPTAPGWGADVDEDVLRAYPWP